jgi:PAS domain-containing protein
VAAGSGIYEAPGEISGATRSTAVYPLRDYPLVVDVDIHTSIAGWRHLVLVISLGSVLVVVILAGVLLLLREQLHRLAENARALHLAAVALRRSESALAEKSRALETTLGYMDQGILLVTADRRVGVWNARAAALLDLPEVRDICRLPSRRHDTRRVQFDACMCSRKRPEFYLQHPPHRGAARARRCIPVAPGVT